MRCVSGLIPARQCSEKLLTASLRILADRMTLAMMRGLKTLSSKCPMEPPMETAVWFPMT